MSRARTGVTLLRAMRDPKLFGPWFRNPTSWAAWRAFLSALFALPMGDDELATFRACTGRATPPAAPLHEAWLICGRRAGKSFILALVAVFLACFRDWRRHLAPGEHATIMIIARDRKQARVIFRFIRGLLTGVPMLKALIEGETREVIDLRNQVTIEVHSASYRSVRGYTVVAALLDELAFFPTDDAADPDKEIIAALRPAMSTIPGAMLLCASSPYARRGALWEAHRKHFGRDGDPVLVWQAPTRVMNPTVRQRVIDEAMENDPAWAAAEYGAQFRADIEGYIQREAVEACMSEGVFERPPLPGIRYHAFVDPSGGSADSMTLAITHYDRADDIVVVDAIREVKPPFSPEVVVQEFTQLLKSYRIARIIGDRYGGEFCREPFRKRGILYELADRTKSEFYVDLLPRINSQRADLLDHPRFVNQLVQLERRTARSNKESIDHPPGGHDDIANAVAGAICLAGAKRGPMVISESVKAWAAIPRRVNRLDGGPGWMSLYSAKLKERREPKTIATISTIDRPAGAVFRVGLGGHVTRVNSDQDEN